MDMIEDYTKRISKYHKLQIIEIKDEDTLEKEYKSMVKYIDSNEYVIALDIKGETLTSEEFASKIDTTFQHHGTITFVIGSSLGIHEEIKQKADMRLSFSSMTFPHGLFRAIFLEQLYRSFKINNNETYHK